mmetsp:Transcript_8550/g.26762  ORF Transcript_8550/g.26762 Transcript_8550/m.26762 type:complete len:244 (-) Transcript_8550:275-1006(-)
MSAVLSRFLIFLTLTPEMRWTWTRVRTRPSSRPRRSLRTSRSVGWSVAVMKVSMTSRSSTKAAASSGPGSGDSTKAPRPMSSSEREMSREPVRLEARCATRIWRRETPLETASSATVGRRPSEVSSLSARATRRFARSWTWGGTFTRERPSTACWIEERIHHVAYVEIRNPLDGSYRSTAVARPSTPSATRSPSETSPSPSVFCARRYVRRASLTTSRMFESTSRSRAAAPSRRAAATASADS